MFMYMNRPPLERKVSLWLLPSCVSLEQTDKPSRCEMNTLKIDMESHDFLDLLDRSSMTSDHRFLSFLTMSTCATLGISEEKKRRISP